MGRRIANDNIKTSHLKCRDCGTRAHLTSITSLGDGELRTFQCDLCGQANVLHVGNVSKDGSRNSRDAC